MYCIRRNLSVSISVAFSQCVYIAALLLAVLVCVHISPAMKQWNKSFFRAVLAVTAATCCVWPLATASGARSPKSIWSDCGKCGSATILALARACDSTPALRAAHNFD